VGNIRIDPLLAFASVENAAEALVRTDVTIEPGPDVSRLRRGLATRFAPSMVVLGLLAAACTTDATGNGPSGPVREPGQPLGFTDVAADVGLDFQHSAFHWDITPDVGVMHGGGVCWLDYDGDGWMDLFAVNSYSQAEAGRWLDEGGLPRSALFHNEEGMFTDVSAGSGADVAIRGNGCVAADFDLDGRTDLYVTGSQASVLLWNEGGGQFSDGTTDAGVEAFGWRAGAAVGDVNADGWPDLFVAGYVDLANPVPQTTLGFPNTYLGVRDLLYLSQGPAEDGGVTFREVGVDAGLEVASFEYGLGAVLTDADNDGDLDLYVANDTKPNRLYDNVPWPGGIDADPAGLGFRFEELAGKAGVADPGAGMGVAAGDDDGDGRQDLFVANARSQVHGMFRGKFSDVVDPSFRDVRAAVGIDLSGSTGWGVSWADLDLDTDLDLVLVNGDIPITDLLADAQQIRAFENLTAQGEPGLYGDLSTVGLAEVGSLNARGSAVADFDNDGDLDIAINSIGGQLVLLGNTGTEGTWLEVSLGSFAPGAQVSVRLPGGTELTREIQAGSSYLSSADPRTHFGLGDATVVDRVVVRWPDGQETTLSDVAAGQAITVEAP
jgi:ASPIC and UnbV/FG-GAP-like repeat